jgi:uncharacterized lipoprotein NlpE involved in copper resistance
VIEIEKKAATAEELEAVKSAIDLLSDIEGTTQNVTLNADGTVQKIEHINTSSVIVRTDTFTYAANTITEVRTLASGATIAFVYHTDTLQTEVI